MASVLPKHGETVGTWLGEPKDDVHVYVSPVWGATIGHNNGNFSTGSELAVTLKDETVSLQYHEGGEVKFAELDKDKFKAALIMFLTGLKTLAKK